MKKTILCLLLAIFSCLLLSACNGELPEGDRIVVSYYLEDGSAPLTVTVTNGSLDLSVTPSRKHYSFLGLFDSKIGGTMIMNAEGFSSIFIDRPLTLYARWEPATYTVTFDPGEGTLPEVVSERAVMYNTVIGDMPIPTPPREDLRFVGWYSGEHRVSDGGTPIGNAQVLRADIYAILTDSKTVPLTAVYSDKTYAVTLDYNTPGYENATYYVKHGEAFDLSLLPTEDTGTRILADWSLQPNRLQSFDGTVTGDITLYAQWADYRLATFHVKGEEPFTAKILRGKDQAPVMPDRTGYDFSGWYASETLSGNPLEAISYASTVTDYYAEYTLTEYPIVYVVDGTPVTLAPFSYTVESAFYLPTPSAPGRTFRGWCRKADCSDTPFRYVEEGTIGRLILYACFE